MVTNDKILWFDREALLSAFAIEITAEIDLPSESLILDIKRVREYDKYPFLVIREAKQIYHLNVNNGQLRCILESEVIVNASEHSRKQYLEKFVVRGS